MEKPSRYANLNCLVHDAKHASTKVLPSMVRVMRHGHLNSSPSGISGASHHTTIDVAFQLQNHAGVQHSPKKSLDMTGKRRTVLDVENESPTTRNDSRSFMTARACFIFLVLSRRSGPAMNGHVKKTIY